jgi:hypothetical protein
MSSANPNTKRFLREFPKALHEGVGAVFVGAGTSVAAKYPSWADLLTDIGEEIGVRSRDIHDLAALAQWHISETGGSRGVRQVIKREIDVDRDIPPAIEILARLPTRHIWTTNYDRLIERAFQAINRPLDTVSGAANLALRATPGAARLYKMHGSIDRLDDIVISTDDYELFGSKRGAFRPLLQAHLSSMSMLFVGLSLTDPNIRHVLSLIRESFTEAPPEHFAIVKPPSRADEESDDAFKARMAQHRLWAKDLARYGLVAVEVETYEEIPELLMEIERRVAAQRVWVSGSWPLEVGGDKGMKLYRLSEAIGRLIGEAGRDLVSGSGVLVGSATMSGFIEALRHRGGWDLDRRLIARSFPQAVPGIDPEHHQWKALRAEMARLAGVVIFIAGAKPDGDGIKVADGVLEEFEMARDAGAFLLPIGATGGAAEVISQRLLGSDVSATGHGAVRPTDDELVALNRTDLDAENVVKIVSTILKRVERGA